MKRLTLISLVLLGSILLSACVGAGSRSASWPGLTTDASTAYLAKDQSVYAVRLSDGVKLWQYPDKAGASLFDANPVLTPDGQLLVASAGTDHALISLDPATGKEKWPAQFTGSKDRWIASPLVLNDVIYAPNVDGTLYALNLSTGGLLWQLPVGSSLWSGPVTNGKLIFLTSLDHFLYAVDPQTHQIAWKVNLDGSAPGSPSVSADGSTLYVGSFASKVYAIDAATGQIRWSTKTANWVWGTPGLSGDAIYIADINGQIYSLGSTDGQNAWPVLAPDGPVTASPLVLPNGVVVATESGSVYAFDAKGNPLWPAVDIGGKIYTSPVLAGDLIVVAPMGAPYLLYALNTRDGSLLPWHFDGK